MNVAAFGNNPEQTGAFKVSDNDITDFVAGLSEKESFVDHFRKSHRQGVAHGAVDVNLQFGFGRRPDQT